MDRNAKEQVVGQIQESFSDVMSIVLADFRGLDVPSVSTIRDEFRKAECGYRVLKNTLVKRAIEGSELEPMGELLAGPTAVIWSKESPSAAAKVAVKQAKEHKKFVIKGGFFGGELLDLAGVERLSKMPDKPQCQSNLLMTFLAGPQQHVRTLVAGPMSFLYLLQARERSL